MQMNKQNKSFVAMYAIVAVVYILLFALIPFPKDAAAWLMFVFSLIAVAGSCAVTLYTLGKDSSLMSKFYGYPVFKIGMVYMLLQLGFSVLIYIIGSFAQVPYWVALLLSLILAGGAGIGVIAADNAREFVEQMDDHTVEVTGNVTYFQLDARDILELCQDDALRPELEALVTKCKYSDPVSVPETRELEEEIKALLQELRKQVAENKGEEALAKAQLILRLLSSRNRIKSVQ